MEAKRSRVVVSDDLVAQVLQFYDEQEGLSKEQRYILIKARFSVARSTVQDWLRTRGTPRIISPGRPKLATSASMSLYNVCSRGNCDLRINRPVCH
jgi:hypothetical protein